MLTTMICVYHVSTLLFLGYYFENQKRFDKANKNNNEQGENND